MTDYPSRENCQRLAEAGIDFPESERVWMLKRNSLEDKWTNEKIVTRKGYIITWHPTVKFLPAPSLADLLGDLPKNAWYLRSRPNGNTLCGIYAEWFIPQARIVIDRDLQAEADTPQNAAAQMRLKLEELKNAN